MESPTQSGDLVLPVESTRQSAENPPELTLGDLGKGVPEELWLSAEAKSLDLTLEEFSAALASIGAKFNHGLPSDARSNPTQKTAFFRSLRLPELALAQACALGRETAWQRFIELYRIPLRQAAIAITNSTTLGYELAESLYAELYGLRQRGSNRQCPLASYSGRGSLLGWLRSTLAQRHVDYHRLTRREAPLDTFDAPAPEHQALPVPEQLAPLQAAIANTLKALPAEDRLLLAAYFLDRQTLLQIARTLHVHEATISRRLKRLVSDLRKHLLDQLQSGGLSKRAAEEALGVDPRDVEINLRTLLQTSQSGSFSNKTVLPAVATETPL